MMGKLPKKKNWGSFVHRGLRYDFLRKKIWTVPLSLQFNVYHWQQIAISPRSHLRRDGLCWGSREGQLPGKYSSIIMISSYQNNHSFCVWFLKFSPEICCISYRFFWISSRFFWISFRFLHQQHQGPQYFG